MMNIQMTFPPEFIDAIADRVVEKLLPRLQEEEDQLLNIEQASVLLGKSKEQIYQWVFNAKHGMGDFPYQKQGKTLRFWKKELKRWMKPR